LAERDWRLPHDPADDPDDADPTEGEQALGAGMKQAMDALRGMLTGDPSAAAPPPNLAALIAGAAKGSGKSLFGGMMTNCELMPMPPEGWTWSDAKAGQAAEIALTSVGLQRVGYYQVVLPFTPGFGAYVDAARGFYAIVYDDFYQSAITLECRSHCDNGDVFSVTTRADLAAMPLPPWRRVEVVPVGTKPADVVKRFLAERPGAGKAAASHFVSDYQDTWRRENEWRAKQ
jgi:hypothetical protein